MNVNAIEIRGLEKRFPKFHLGPVDLTVPQGAIYGFIGPNGSGKTTTIDMILGFGSKNAGSIRVLGMDHVLDEVRVKQQVGYVSPEINYSAWGKVGNLVQFVQGFYPSWDNDQCNRLLNAFGINPSDKIVSLSFGTRIKLSLALALAWHPRVLILDEPTVGLDAVSKEKVFAELLSVVRDESRTVFISSHNLADLERYADYIGVLKAGRLVLEGPTLEIVERYRIVDFTLAASPGLKSREGFLIQKREQTRWRAVVNTQDNPVEWIASKGGTEINVSPVTLEELFVALATEDRA